MRTSLPVIDEQVIIPESYRLISKTDLKGNILEANFEFIGISGYHADELIGQPHNLLRHPDVPKAAFKDLWQTIQAGKGWTQIVKNRTKCGRYYWVKANVAPIERQGVITGYISIRKPATTEEIKLATQAYQQINQGKLTISEGVISSPLSYKLNQLNPFKTLGLIGKTVSISLILIIMGISITAYVEFSQYQLAKQNTLHEHSLSIEDKLNAFIKNTTEADLNLALSISAMPDVRFSLEENLINTRAKNALKILQEKFEMQDIRMPRIVMHTPEGTAFLRTWNDKQGDDLTSFRHSINHIRAEQKQSFHTFELGRSGVPLRTIVPIYSNFSKDFIGSLEILSSTDDFTNFFKMQGMSYFTLLTEESLTTTDLIKADHHFQKYAIINSKYMDQNIAQYLTGINLAELLSTGYLLSTEHFITNFPVYDFNNQLIGYHILVGDVQYINNINIALFENAVETIMQMSLAMILMAIAFLLFILISIIRPIKRLASIIQTAKIKGDLTLRGDASSQDEIGLLSKSYNSQMQTMQTIMGESGRMMHDLSQGNFATQISVPMKGDFAVMSNSLSDLVATMDLSFKEIKQVLNNIQEGNFTKTSTFKTSGEFEEVMQQSRDLVLTLQNIFNEINDLMSQVALGHFNGRITAKAEGELKTLTENINKSLNKLEEVISETTNVMISQGSGNLKARIKADFAGTLSILKNGINNSATNMAAMMAQSNYFVAKLSEGAIAISQDIRDLSARTQEQAAAVEQTAASMEQITATIQQTASNSLSANKMANTSLTEAQQANEVVQNTILSINDINEASQKISEITALIDSIAFQTNLLALNAAVEAARAGEHGRGFAVVAAEVRNLAGKSAEAAKDIRILINDTVKKVNKGAELAQESGQALEVINKSVAQISGLVNEITQTTAEQAKGVDQVNTALSSIDQAIQQNSLLVEETATRTNNMQLLATTVINTIKVDVDQIGLKTAMQTGQFAFANARRAHWQLKASIIAKLQGMEVEINEATAINHRLSGLGKWFFGEEGQQYAHLPEMQAVDKYHAEFHAIVKQLLEAQKAGDTAFIDNKLAQLDKVGDLVVKNLFLAEEAVAKSSEDIGSAFNKPEKKTEPVIKTVKASLPVKPKKATVTKKPIQKTQTQSKSALQTPAPTQPKQDDGDEWGDF